GAAPLEERRARARRLSPVLAELQPDLAISLDWQTPLQLLVATILSAQCTDERVNQVTPALFARCPEAKDYAEIPQSEMEKLIRSTGFYRNKARHIRGMAERLVERHDGRVPRTMDELTDLPGVARKTANVVLSNAFGISEGVVVDTHVKRVAGRLGLTAETDPVKVERDLMEVLPREEWHPFAWRLLVHGRRRCRARRPDCEGCEISGECPSAFTFG
ncbi:MAG: endonuclease III, partial [Gemmatimonadota bacterium]|nr:endonuclease III [Gemmatimonadota bacterium]